jgi:hypothetical protein
LVDANELPIIPLNVIGGGEWCCTRIFPVPWSVIGGFFHLAMRQCGFLNVAMWCLVPWNMIRGFFHLAILFGGIWVKSDFVTQMMLYICML